MSETPRPATNVQSDDALVERLRAIAAELEPPPASLAASARELLTWRRVDAELAELLSDSDLEDARAALVRGERTSRSVSFASGALTIEVDLLLDGARRRLVGQLVPPGSAQIELQSGAERRTIVADELGRFHAAEIGGGRLRLRVSGHAAPGQPVETSWIAI